MPRLPADAIKQGLLHPDADVRFTALHHFADAHSPDASVMPVVIDALEKYGRHGTFQFLHLITNLAQSEATVAWAVKELTTRPARTEEERNYLRVLARLLSDADPRLVRPHNDTLQVAPAFGPEFRSRVARRITYLSQDGDALWRELEAICEAGMNKQYVKDVRWADGLDIVEELARQGEQHADRVMDLLKLKVENYEGSPHAWMEPLAVSLAGKLRHEPAIPLIVAKLHEDGDVLGEQCQYALVKIGTDAVVEAVRDAYPTAEWHFRLYANSVFGGIPSDLAIQTGIKLLETEADLDLENFLAQALVEQLSTEGNEAAYRVLQSDPDLRDLRDKLVAACTLTGQEFPELEGWRKEIRDEKQRKPFMFGGPVARLPVARIPAVPKPASPVPQARQKVGRNDPCPCGSGKKFKKCCMPKGGSDL